MTDEDIESLPVMQEWKRATEAVIEAGGVAFVIHFMRTLADNLERSMVLNDEEAC